MSYNNQRYMRDVKQLVVLFVRVGDCYPAQQFGLRGTLKLTIFKIVNCFAAISAEI
jgi:hypothetical protein